MNRVEYGPLDPSQPAGPLNYRHRYTKTTAFGTIEVERSAHFNIDLSPEHLATLSPQLAKLLVETAEAMLGHRVPAPTLEQYAEARGWSVVSGDRPAGAITARPSGKRRPRGWRNIRGGRS